MPINVTVFGKEELIEKWNSLSPKIAAVMQSEMQAQMTRLADWIKENKLSGDPLHRRTGALSRSVQGSSAITGTTRVTGTIGSKGVKYARVHELGGTFEIPAHERLQTMVFGKPMVPRSVTVRAHTATYPQRAFLKPSLQVFEPQIRDALRQRVLDVLNATTA
jgi:phage gpG-like protein